MIIGVILMSMSASLLFVQIYYSSYYRTLYSSSYIVTQLLFLPIQIPLWSRCFCSLDLTLVCVFLKLSAVNPLYYSQKIVQRLVLVRSCSLQRYIIIYINSTSSSFNALSALIPYLYLLAITAYSSSISAIVVGIRIGIRVKL